MMNCSNCSSINVCKFVAEMKTTEEQVKNIAVDRLPFSVTIACKYFNEDKRTKGFDLLALQQRQHQNQSYSREDIPRV